MSMNHKQRVKAALGKQPVDRIPIFMWFHPETARKLSRLLDIPVSAVSEAMGNDIQQTWVNNNYAMEGIEHERDGETHVDWWGITWQKRHGFNQISSYPPAGASREQVLAYEFPTDGETHVDWWGITWQKRHGFNQISSYPLAGASREQVLAYEFPADRRDELLALMDPVLRDRRDFFIGCDVSPCVFEMYWRLRGMEDGMTDIAGDPELAFEMFHRCADFAIDLGTAACDRFALDWYWRS